MKRRDERFQLLEMAILMIAAVFVVLGTYAQSFGDTANSRLATVYALTKHGTWFIDRPVDEEPNRFEQGTIDKVIVNGRMLSSKPPVLPLMMTAEYWVLHHAFGLSLDDPDETNEIIRYMSMLLIGLPYIIGLLFFAKTLKLFVDDPLARMICLVGVAFGTQLWGYSTNINNHGPAAALLVIAVYYALGLGSGKLDPAPWRFFMFGLTGGLVPTIDTPGAIFVLFAGVYLVYKLPRPTLIWTTMGAAIPIGVHCGILWATTGSPLPVQTRAEPYLYEASYWRNPRGIDALTEPKLNYLFHATFGRVGIFSLYPITIFGVIAAVWAWRKDHPLKHYLAGGLACFLILTAYYVRGTNNYGGEAYGFRWFIVAMPMLLLMAAPFLAAVRNRVAWLAIALCLAISFYSAWQSSHSPWGSNREWTVRFMGRSYEW